MYYPSSENKGADQLCGYREADLRHCFRPSSLLVFLCSGSNIMCDKLLCRSGLHFSFTDKNQFVFFFLFFFFLFFCFVFLCCKIMNQAKKSHLMVIYIVFLIFAQTIEY